MSAGNGIQHSDTPRERTARRSSRSGSCRTATASRRHGCQAISERRSAPAFRRTGQRFEDDQDALPIRTDARVLGATLKAGDTAAVQLPAPRYGYLVPAKGAVEVNGVRLDARDGAAIREVDSIRVTALEDASWCWRCAA